ncbi:hypothetical protein DL991_40900 [Amycolatopsis sp. WAC 01375]|uniref:hypothetical protein n=1 Tax=Amycolatopsis sp. WAC 01375 TaxID=2203194 RepID=UPI000F7AE931|nr:hypothetical protein [Amycolatopsis sp. WAC 01375]RSM68938.1 hypothetical protein DL991_40900 [Amycolatopsis sp. WAC 01375]
MGRSTSVRQPSETDREHFERELFEYSNHTIVESATVENVFYAAVRTKGTRKVWALVVTMRKAGGAKFRYLDMMETDGPSEAKAPAAVLNALSPTTDKKALSWRERCRTRR